MAFFSRAFRFSKAIRAFLFQSVCVFQTAFARRSMEPFSLPPALVSPVNRVKQCLLNDDSKLESKLESTARFTYKRMQEKSRRECHAVLSDIYLNSSLPEPKETELLRAWIRILPAPGDDGLTEQERMQCIKQDELADVSEQEWKSFLFSCVKATVADAENAITAERSRFEKVTQELRQFGWSRSEDFPRFPSRTKTFSLALFLEDQIVSQLAHPHFSFAFCKVFYISSLSPGRA